MNHSEIPDLAKAVNRWLSYQLLSGRGPLLSESYLGHPLAEFLIHRHSGDFETEIGHPVLNAPGPGRPRQIDYVLLTPNTKVIETAIECKWIAEGPYDKQRIMNDLLRLECVRVPGKHVKRYLVVAGRAADFDRNFRGLGLNTGRGGRISYTETLLSFSTEASFKAVDVRNCEKRFREFYAEFTRAFNAELPGKFTTALLGLQLEDEVSVGVWQIGSVQKRSTFNPAEYWLPT